MLLCEHARDGIDLLRVLRMALIHDIVEIDAGDTLIYDMEARKDQAEREERAARRLFGMLPGGQAEEMLALWREFEAGETAEARYARAVDRFSAIVLNHAAQGKAWKEHGIRAGQIMEVNRRIDLGSPALWDFTREMIEEAIREGFLDV
jgi:putative hydrolase of HD superfamily